MHAILWRTEEHPRREQDSGGFKMNLKFCTANVRNVLHSPRIRTSGPANPGEATSNLGIARQVAFSRAVKYLPVFHYCRDWYKYNAMISRRRDEAQGIIMQHSTRTEKTYREKGKLPERKRD